MKTKRKLYTAHYVLLLTLLLLFLAVPVSAGEHYLLIGDSYGSQEYKRQRFNSVIREVPVTWIQNLEMYYLKDVESVSERGAGFVMKGAHGNNFVNLAGSCHVKNPAAITRVLVGGGQGNDARAIGMGDATKEQIKAGMRTFTRTVKNRFPNAKILYAPINWAAKSGTQTSIKIMNNFLIPYAKSLGWVYLEGTDSALKLSDQVILNYFYNDYSHPNKPGQWRITNAIVKALKTKDKTISKTEKARAQEAAKTVPVLLARVYSTSKTSITLKWDRTYPGAASYELWGCRQGQRFKKIDTFSTAVDTTARKQLEKGTFYVYQFRALNAKKQVIGKSRKLYVVTRGGEFANVTKISVADPSVNVPKGDLYRILPTSELGFSGKKEMIFNQYVYVSTAPGIATVSSSGYIHGIYPGTCKIYVIAQSGVHRTIYVKVY